jgi:hypothetical protein
MTGESMVTQGLVIVLGVWAIVGGWKMFRRRDIVEAPDGKKETDWFLPLLGLGLVCLGVWLLRWVKE